jgi:hypothetical protein
MKDLLGSVEGNMPGDSLKQPGIFRPESFQHQQCHQGASLDIINPWAVYPVVLRLPPESVGCLFRRWKNRVKVGDQSHTAGSRSPALEEQVTPASGNPGIRALGLKTKRSTN